MHSCGPKISCLTVTGNRLVMLKEAIDCYCRQTYPNREMVIVAGGDDYCRRIQNYVKSLGRGDIRLVSGAARESSLGELRNLSLEAARGEVFCQWDDDDLSHPERLSKQWERMREARSGACFFSDHLQFFVARRELFWVDWTLPGNLPAGHELVPGTVMAFASAAVRYPAAGIDATIGEDNAFRDLILSKMEVTSLQTHGYLYLYRFHGRNTTTERHHRRLAGFGCREVEYLNRQKAVLAESLLHYPLPRPFRIMARVAQQSRLILASTQNA